MHAGLFDMLHDRTDHDPASVGDGVDVHLHRLVEKPVQKHRRRMRHVEGIGQVSPQFALRVDDLHRPATQHVGWPEDHGEPDLPRRHETLVKVRHRSVGRLLQPDLFDHGLKSLPILRTVDRVRAGAHDGHSRSMQLVHEFQRSLSPELHDHAFRLLDLDDGQHVLKRHRLEVQAVGRVVVRRHRLRIAVHHDRFESVLAHGQRRVYTTVVEFDALADSVRAAAEHHDLSCIGRCRFALLLERGIEVRSACGELRRACVHALEDGL